MRKSGRENKRTDLSLRYFVGYAVRRVSGASLGQNSQSDAASVTARGQNCPVSPAGEQLGDRWYVTAKKSGFQFTKRSNWSTVNARTPNIRWHSTLLWPRTRTCRAPNSSFSRPLTRSTVDRSR